MKHRVVALLVVVLFSVPALAQMKSLPMWTQRKCPTETFACYNFRQAKDLEKFDIDLQFMREELDSYIKTNQDLGKAVTELQESNGLLQQSAINLEQRLTEKQAVLVTTTETVVKLEKQNIFGGALPWVIVAVVTVAAGAFVGGYYLGSK